MVPGRGGRGDGTFRAGDVVSRPRVGRSAAGEGAWRGVRRPSSVAGVSAACHGSGRGSRISTNSSAIVGWIAIVASNCALVAPQRTATARP